MMQTSPQARRLWMQRTANGLSWSQETFSREYGSGLRRWITQTDEAVFLDGFVYGEENIPLPGWGANGGLPIVALRYPTFEKFL
jgi:hypothetical protein